MAIYTHMMTEQAATKRFYIFYSLIDFLFISL
jgi:hypothetical protein